MNTRELLTVGWRLTRLWRSQFWSRDRIAAYQQHQLVSALREAVIRVPHYRRLGVDPHEIRSPSDLQLFPYLSKQQVQQRPDDFIADGSPAEQLNRSRTSGSTCEPMVTYFDRSCWLTNKFAVKMRRTLSRGVLNTRRLLVVTGARVCPVSPGLQDAIRVPIIGKQVGYKTISIHADAHEALSAVQDFRPTAIYAFPSWLLEVIAAAEKSHQHLPKIPVIFTSSEVLTDTMRDRINKSFRTCVCDIYGNTEFKEIAWQCEHERYHVNFENVWVEDGVDADDHQAAGLALTTLNNRAMPLIRYAVGDLGRVHEGDCSCGRNSPYLTDVHGRQTELLQLADGRRLSPYLLSMSIESHPYIAKYQLVQPRQGCLLVNYVTRRPYPNLRMIEDLSARLRNVVGSDTDLQFQEFSAIPRSRSGKHKILIRAGSD